MSSFVRKAAEGSLYWAYQARQDLIKALQEYNEEEAEEEEEEDEDKDSDVGSDDDDRIGSP